MSYHLLEALKLFNYQHYIKFLIQSDDIKFNYMNHFFFFKCVVVKIVFILGFYHIYIYI